MENKKEPVFKTTKLRTGRFFQARPVVEEDVTIAMRSPKDGPLRTGTRVHAGYRVEINSGLVDIEDAKTLGLLSPRSGYISRTPRNQKHLENHPLIEFYYSVEETVSYRGLRGEEAKLKRYNDICDKVQARAISELTVEFMLQDLNANIQTKVSAHNSELTRDMCRTYSSLDCWRFDKVEDDRLVPLDKQLLQIDSKLDILKEERRVVLEEIRVLRVDILASHSEESVPVPEVRSAILEKLKEPTALRQVEWLFG